MKEISICIPLHDPRELHYFFLLEALESIKIQTFSPLEVLISGSYKPSYIDRLLKIHSNFFKIRFIKNRSVSTSSNLNSIIPYSSGEVVKILFQDDFFISNTALAKTSSIFDKKSIIWLACGSRNFNDANGKYIRDIYPKFRNNIAKGINSIGSPSVIAFRKDYFLPFNENLVWMLDCEWYLQMKHKYGFPALLKDFQIANRLHEFQATHVAKIHQKSEVAIVKKIHPWNNFSNVFRVDSNRKNCPCSEKPHEK